MAEALSIPGLGGAKAVPAPAEVFGAEFNPGLVHQAVVAWYAGARQGTAAQKGRGDVRGGGRKPWRQKRTGRARAGSIRSPLWRGGGVHFAASPRSYVQKLNRKMYRGALRSVLSELLRREALAVVKSLQPPAPKTRELVAMLDKLGVAGERVLLVTEAPSAQLELASRNLPNASCCTYDRVHPALLAGAGLVVMEEAAVAPLAEWLA